jgi:hypothetical protein
MIHLGVEKFLEAIDYGPNKLFLAHISHCEKCRGIWDQMQQKIKKQYEFTQTEIDLYGDVSHKGLG